MYYLMNKNKAVMSFEENAEESKYSDNTLFECKDTMGKLPLGFQNINKWIEGRKSTKHNNHLKSIMKVLNCDNNKGFIEITHAASINDTFWIKTSEEKTQWEDVSLYRNEFTEVISKLAFEGVGLQGVKFSTTSPKYAGSHSPELACEGSYRKCFRKEKDTGQYGSDIFIYKRGGEVGQGIEPYCEQMASEIAAIISPEKAVQYDLCLLHGKAASRCNLFTSEQYGYVPYAAIRNTDNLMLPEVSQFYKSINAQQAFDEMLVIDALCFNQDRHAGNYGVLVNNDTLEIVDMANIFDFNISLFPFVNDNSLHNIGDVIYKTEPKLGEDFTRMGQMGINEITRERVKTMRDFTFCFRGDDVVSPERVKMIEAAVQKQAKAILLEGKVYAIDVFPSKQVEQEKVDKEAEASANSLLCGFEERVKSLFNEDGKYQMSCCNEGEVALYIENTETFNQIEIDFKKGDINVTKSGTLSSWQYLKNNDKELYHIGKRAVSELKKFLNEKGDKTFAQYFNKQSGSFDGYF